MARLARPGTNAARRINEQTRRRLSNLCLYSTRYRSAIEMVSLSARIFFEFPKSTLEISSPLSRAINIPLPVNGSMNDAASPMVNNPLSGWSECLPKFSRLTASQGEHAFASASVWAARRFWQTTSRMTRSASAPHVRTSRAEAIKQRLLKPFSMVLSPPYPP